MVEGWLIKRYPLRLGKVRPIIPQSKEQGRHRSKSPDRRRSREREGQPQDPNIDPWKLGEDMENQRRGLLRALNLARKELSEKGKVTDEMKIYLQATIEGVGDSETKEEAIDFLEILPNIERINHLKFLTSESHQEEIIKQFEEGVLRVEDFSKGTTNESEGVRETPNMPGASSSKDHASIKAIKIIKVEMEQNEEVDVEKIGLTVLLAMALSVAVQWLFGKCPRRKHQVDQEVKVKMIKKQEDEGSEDFELVPSIEDVEEPSNEDEQQKSEKEQKAETTLIAFKVMLIDA